MFVLERQITDVAQAVDDIHALVDSLHTHSVARRTLDDVSIDVLKIAVHEWVANLIQHADFSERAPRVRITLTPHGHRMRCTIDDNSRGFDFASQVLQQDHLVNGAPAPPDRGRGLLIIIACTEDLRYRPRWRSGDYGPDDDLRQRLEFWVDGQLSASAGWRREAHLVSADYPTPIDSKTYSAEQAHAPDQLAAPPP